MRKTYIYIYIYIKSREVFGQAKYREYVMEYKERDSFWI